jgi:SAM-dependent methyltransferase
MSGTPAVLPLPPASLRFMNETDEALIRIGRGLADLLVENGLSATSALIDVGSGYGRLPLGLERVIRYRGRYVGFDILARQVTWCAANLTPAAPNLRFRHLDVRNDRYNPRGRIDPAAMRFPARTGSFDVAAVFSVFTHLHAAAIRHYLAEIHRVLRPGGVAVTTWFTFDDNRLAAVISEAATHPMRHVLAPGIRYAYPDDPLHAIAYDDALVREMVRTADFEVVSMEAGSWSGEAGRRLQDVLVLRRGHERSAPFAWAGDATFWIRDQIAAVASVGRRVVRRIRRRLRSHARRA